MKTNKELQVIISKLASKYLKGLGLSGSQIDYLKNVLTLTWRMGDRNGSQETFEDIMKTLK
jgi:hypothetical protein